MRIRNIFNKIGLFLLSINTVFFVPWFFASCLLSALSTRPPIIDFKYLIMFFGAHPVWHNFQTAMNNQHRTFVGACFAGIIFSLFLTFSANSLNDWRLKQITIALLFSSFLAYGFDGLPGIGAAGWNSSIPTLFTRMFLYISIGVLFYISTKWILNNLDFRRARGSENSPEHES